MRPSSLSDAAPASYRRRTSCEVLVSRGHSARSLSPAGATFADVVKTTVYLADIADFAAVNEIYASKFEAPFPARSAFQVAALPAGGLVEIEVVAAL